MGGETEVEPMDVAISHSDSSGEQTSFLSDGMQRRHQKNGHFHVLRATQTAHPFSGLSFPHFQVDSFQWPPDANTTICHPFKTKYKQKKPRGRPNCVMFG